MGIDSILITSKDATAEAAILLQLHLNNARLVRVEPHHMQAKEAWPTPWTQRPRSQFTAGPCLSIIFADVGVVAFCLLGALPVMRKVFMAFEALEHALPMPWDLFVTLCGVVFATLGGGTVLAII
jgi:hypothetical protein